MFLEGSTTSKFAISDTKFAIIVANSGKEMFNGEKVDLDKLFVWTSDDKPELIQVAELSTDPTKQTENYYVNIQADHDESTTKTFGTAKVWIENNQLMARVQFADNDLGKHYYGLPDLRWSVSITWEDDEKNRGILTDISAVYIPNDPRAKTVSKNGLKKGHIIMDKKEKNALTADEAKKLVADVTEIIEGAVGETEEVVDETDDTDEVKAEETTEKNSAKSPVFITVNQKGASAGSSVSSGWVKTREAADKFVDILLNEKDGADVFGIWNDMLKEKDAITYNPNEITLLPEFLIKEIRDIMRTNAEFFSATTYVGGDYYNAGIITSADGGRGHVDGQTKIEEQVTVVPRVLVAECLYKFQRLARTAVKRNNGALRTTLLRELATVLTETWERAAIVGGVMNDEASNPTAFTALNPILGDVMGDTANAAIGTQVSYDGSKSWRYNISMLANAVKSGTNRWLITTSNKLAEIEDSLIGQFPAFPNGISATAPGINGITRIHTPNFLTDDMLDGAIALCVDAPAYYRVGDSVADEDEAFDIPTNKHLFLRELYTGGGLVAPKSVAALVEGSVSA